MEIVVSKKQRAEIRERIQLKPKKVDKVAALFKIIMIGDANTGKTSLIIKFVDGKFDRF